MVDMAGETVLVDHKYSRCITEHTAFLRKAPSQIVRKRPISAERPQRQGEASTG